jgi:hypothetical protein
MGDDSSWRADCFEEFAACRSGWRMEAEDLLNWGWSLYVRRVIPVVGVRRR